MKKQLKEQDVLKKSGTYRFVKVNGTMIKVEVQHADAAFEAAMKIRTSRRKDLDKELFINGVTS
ncbi:hypothetical protein [Aliivibrio fischeri]|uniref:hypothetical protein n=1 Tax=Aliivibrio fischeri TaxID=668 RepID=UPI00084C6BD9|nr:hypothetical protein [Aliivibrio fischeri]OED53480.1 hypothetical protein BEI46_17605 [Aliivibrio fischeri]